mgnify:CR=1 FL=1
MWVQKHYNGLSFYRKCKSSFCLLASLRYHDCYQMLRGCAFWVQRSWIYCPRFSTSLNCLSNSISVSKCFKQPLRYRHSRIIPTKKPLHQCVMGVCRGASLLAHHYPQPQTHTAYKWSLFNSYRTGHNDIQNYTRVYIGTESDSLVLFTRGPIQIPCISVALTQY